MVKPATDKSVDYKRLVREGYDRCSDDYAEARSSESASLDLLLPRLDPGSDVLDLGCGCGVPVASTLALQHRVTGVDFSSEQIRRARIAVPDATFIESDLADLDFPTRSFDAVTAFYVIFHLARDEQIALLRSVATWLRPGGYLLATLSRSNESPYTEEFFGVEMFWTNFALDEYGGMLTALGFEILITTQTGHGFEGDRPIESHPLVLAQKQPPG